MRSTAEELFANAAAVVVVQLIMVEQVTAPNLDKHDAGVIEGGVQPDQGHQGRGACLGKPFYGA